MTHELRCFEECSLFNSLYEYARGYDRAVCSCGWKSVAATGKDKHVALTEVWMIHKLETLTAQQSLPTGTTVTVLPPRALEAGS